MCEKTRLLLLSVALARSADIAEPNADGNGQPSTPVRTGLQMSIIEAAPPPNPQPLRPAALGDQLAAFLNGHSRTVSGATKGALTGALPAAWSLLDAGVVSATALNGQAIRPLGGATPSLRASAPSTAPRALCGTAGHFGAAVRGRF